MTFGAVSVATKHKHWRKTPEQVKPIVEPLTEWLNTLPAEIIEKFEKYAPWVLTLYGCSQVIVPDVLIELELRRMENERRMGGVSGTYGPAQTSGTAAAPVPAGNPETPPANPAVVAPSPDL